MLVCTLDIAWDLIHDLLSCARGSTGRNEPYITHYIFTKTWPLSAAQVVNTKGHVVGILSRRRGTVNNHI